MKAMAGPNIWCKLSQPIDVKRNLIPSFLQIQAEAYSPISLQKLQTFGACLNWKRSEGFADSFQLLFSNCPQCQLLLTNAEAIHISYVHISSLIAWLLKQQVHCQTVFPKSIKGPRNLD